MKPLKSINKFWYAFIFIWVILTFIYESPNILCFSYERGLYQSDINNTLDINVKFKEGWCPSIESVVQNDIFGNKQSQFIYVKNRFFKPWNFSEYLIFSQPNYNNDVIEDRNLFEEANFPWGKAYIISQDGKGLVSIYSKNNNVQISAPDIKLFNEIEQLKGS